MAGGGIAISVGLFADIADGMAGGPRKTYDIQARAKPGGGAEARVVVLDYI